MKRFKKGDFKVAHDLFRDNFHCQGLMDDGVSELKGLFADTLPKANITQLAFLRMDGDMYQSTMDTLTALCAFAVDRSSLVERLAADWTVVEGGVVYSGGFDCVLADAQPLSVDDLFEFEACWKAVRDFRRAHNITETIYAVSPPLNDERRTEAGFWIKGLLCSVQCIRVDWFVLAGNTWTLDQPPSGALFFSGRSILERFNQGQLFYV